MSEPVMVCKANISATGRRQRRRVGMIAGAVALVFGVATLALHLPWFVRAGIALPVMLAAVGFLQASRNTCVARAMEGTFEADDLTTSKMEADDVAASRKVSRTIVRDSVLLAVGVGAVLALSARVF